MLKILQARLLQYVNRELSDVQAGFRKGRGTRDQIANICWIIKKAREFQKNTYFCFTDYAKASDCVGHNCGKFLKRWEYQTTWPASWETYMQVRKQQLELDMEQQTGLPGSILGGSREFEAGTALAWEKLIYLLI